MKKFLTLFTALFLMGSMMVVQAVTYTVAGASSVFGSHWDPADASNDMTLEDGLYKLVKTEVILEDNVELKVVQDHSWGKSWPGSNYVLAIPELAVYTVTVTFNAASETVTATAEKTGEAGPVVSTYTVAGDNTDVFGTEWDPENTNNDMTLEDGLYKWETQVVMPATTIEFKVCKNHGWSNAWPSANYQVTFPKYGEYILTVTFNQDTKDVNANYVEKYYTLVGGSAALFGTAWDLDNADNDMTLQSDGITYKKSYYNVELTAGEIEYKVAADHKWDQTGQFPMSGNQGLSILEDGKYNVTFTYVPSVPSLIAEATLIPEQEIYTVVGSEAALFGTAWAVDEPANDMMLQGDGITYVKSYSNVSLNSGNIEYKVAKDHKWGAGEYPTGGLNQTLNIPSNGTYDVTFTYVPSVPSLEAVATLIDPSEDPEPGQSVYTVVGDNATLFSEAWNPALAVNDMALQGDGITYVKTYSNVSLNNGDIKYKVAANHDWSQPGEYPTGGSPDLVLNIPNDGKYNVTFTYVPSVPSLTAVAEAVPQDVYTVAGVEAAFGSNWDPADANNDMALAGENYTLVKTNVILSENVAFKVCKNHAWTEAWPAQDYVLEISDAGVYTITVTFNESTKEVSAEAVKHTYTVAGSATAFVSDWDPADATNDMAFNGTLFTWQKEDVVLEDNVELKVCLDHGWGTAWPSSNYIISISETAKYTVTVTYNPSSNEVVASAEKTGEAGPVAPATYTVAGSSTAFGSDWNPADENNDMTLVGELYTLVKENLALAGNVEFKVCKNHGWGNAWPADNYVLAIPENAIYKITVTFNESTKEVAAVAEKTGEVGPVYETVRSGLIAGNYYTICYPKSMTDIQGATLWSFIGKDANLAYIQQETAATIEAGKPYLLYAEAETVTAILGDETDAPGANGAIHGTFSDLTQEQLNTYATVAGHDLYLVIGNELRRATGDGTGSNTLPAYRAFVVVNDIPAAPAQMPAHVRSMPMHKDVVTGFENLNATDKPVKLLIDGNIYILRGEKMYDATGRLVK